MADVNAALNAICDNDSTRSSAKRQKLEAEERVYACCCCFASDPIHGFFDSLDELISHIEETKHRAKCKEIKKAFHEAKGWQHHQSPAKRMAYRFALAQVTMLEQLQRRARKLGAQI
jgi:hypothetical protein